MFKNPKEIIATLEDAMNLYSTGNSEINRNKAKLIVFASKCALQAIALDMAERRWMDGTSKIIDIKSNAQAPRISKAKSHASRV